VPQPMPVVIYYTTTIVRGDGTVEFFDDLYGEDDQLERLLGRATSTSGARGRGNACALVP
jgi:murein L,D-transpeptidase YcbB/YkuD